MQGAASIKRININPLRQLVFLIMFFTRLTNASASLLLDFPHFNGRLYGSAESLLVRVNDINNADIFPASIAGLEAQELSAGVIKWFDLLSVMRVAYAHHLGKAGIIAGTVNYGSLAETGNYDRYGNLTGNVNNQDVLVTLAYARKTGGVIQAGVNVKYAYMNLCGVKAGWLGAGFSGLIVFGVPGINTGTKRNFVFGTGMEDINLIKARFENDASEYPVKIHTGFLYRFLKITDIGVKTGMTHTYLSEYGRHYVSAGLEFGYKDFIFIRGGYYLNGRYPDRMALGLGMGKEGLWGTGRSGGTGMTFDYSISFLEEGCAHFLQLGLRFRPADRFYPDREKGEREKNRIQETIKEAGGGKKISVAVRELGEISGIKKADRITVAVLSYINAAASKKWELLTETIPDSVSGSLDDHETIRVVGQDELRDYLGQSGIGEKDIYVDKYLKKIGRDLKADVIIKGSFTEMGVILILESEIWDVREGAVISLIKVTGRGGVNMFDLMDETAQAIVKVLEKHRERD